MRSRAPRGSRSCPPSRHAHAPARQHCTHLHCITAALHAPTLHHCCTARAYMAALHARSTHAARTCSLHAQPHCTRIALHVYCCGTARSNARALHAHCTRTACTSPGVQGGREVRDCHWRQRGETRRHGPAARPKEGGAWPTAQAHSSECPGSAARPCGRPPPRGALACVVLPVCCPLGPRRLDAEASLRRHSAPCPRFPRLPTPPPLWPHPRCSVPSARREVAASMGLQDANPIHYGFKAEIGFV